MCGFARCEASPKSLGGERERRPFSKGPSRSHPITDLLTFLLAILIILSGVFYTDYIELDQWEGPYDD